MKVASMIGVGSLSLRNGNILHISTCFEKKTNFSIFSCDIPTLNPTSNIYQLRSVARGVAANEKMPFVRDRIQESQILQLLSDKSIEAGYILNILYNLDKLNEMKEQQSADDAIFAGDLCEIFMNDFWCEINKFDKRLIPSEDEYDDDEGAVVDQDLNSSNNMDLSSTESEFVSVSEKNSNADAMDSMNQWIGDMDDSNPLLSMIFENCIIKDTDSDNVPISKENNSSYDIYKRLAAF